MCHRQAKKAHFAVLWSLRAIPVFHMNVNLIRIWTTNVVQTNRGWEGRRNTAELALVGFLQGKARAVFPSATATSALLGALRSTQASLSSQSLLCMNALTGLALIW